MSLFVELKRRNVFRVTIAYVIAAWLVAQVADLVLENIGAPEWVIQTLFLMLALGFVAALIISWAYEVTPEGIKRERNVVRDDSITHVTAKKLDIITIGLLVLAIGLLAMDRFVLQRPGPAVVAEPGAVAEQPASPVEPEATSQPERNLKSIAVLPFVNMSSDTEQEYFSDGITEEILNALAKVKQLKVAGRTSSFAFKGKNDDLRLIGDTLGVEHILEGSVRKSGAKVRITAQLIQVEDGFHLWSDSYDREITDVFAIQDEIAAAILKELKAQLLVEEEQALAATRTDTETYNLYLLARQRIYARTRPMLESAVELLDQAIVKDSDYAPAYAQRGIATILLADNSYGTIPEQQAHAQGKEFLQKALTLDPELAEGWAGMGLYHTNQPLEHQQAIEDLNKALAINPNMINASNWLTNVLGNTGQVRAAGELLEQMVATDPLYRPGFNNAVGMFLGFGEEAKAQALIEKVRQLLPDDEDVMRAQAQTYFWQGRMAEAFPLAEAAYLRAPTNRVAKLQFGFTLLNLYEYERVAADGDEFAKAFALDYLGRVEEASIMVTSQADRGLLFPLFYHYNFTGNSDKLIGFLEQRWPDLNAFQADYPYGTFGYQLMAEVALAYSRAGKETQFRDALARVEEAITSLAEQGVDNWLFEQNRAIYFALAGDTEQSLASLAKATDSGLRAPVPLSKFTPAFESIAFDPRLAELEARLLDNVNRDREALGLELYTL